MIFSYRKPVKNNKYGRREEIYVCEDCKEAVHMPEQCKRKDR